MPRTFPGYRKLESVISGGLGWFTKVLTWIIKPAFMVVSLVGMASGLYKYELFLFFQQPSEANVMIPTPQVDLRQSL